MPIQLFEQVRKLVGHIVLKVFNTRNFLKNPRYSLGHEKTHIFSLLHTESYLLVELLAIALLLMFFYFLKQNF